MVGRHTFDVAQTGSDTHHAVYLRLASLGQVYNIDPIVVEILHAAVKVLPQESAGLSGQWDPAETQLLEGEETGSEKAAEGKQNARSLILFRRSERSLHSVSPKSFTDITAWPCSTVMTHLHRSS